MTAHFFLGGADLEMSAIRQLLAEHVPAQRVHDKSLAWGAKTSDYRAEITDALTAGNTVVCIELHDDLNLMSASEVSRDGVAIGTQIKHPTSRSNGRDGVPTYEIVWIDHHDGRAGSDRPTSLEQLFQFLNRPASEWTREQTLIAANDRGHIAALQASGATSEEITRIRAADRAAQGITPDQESAGQRAAAQAESRFHGRLTIVTLPHNRTATVADALHPLLGGPGYENLLVLCPHEINFFGAGHIIAVLQSHFPNGWSGGELPTRGFWGYPARPPLNTLLEILEPALT